MQARRKIFRIEAMRGMPAAVPLPEGERASDTDHREIMSELKALRAMLGPREVVALPPPKVSKEEMAEAHKLKAELDCIYDAINQTKKEIATLHVSGFEGPEMSRVTHELDAVVGGTEKATEQILSAAEFIDQAASTLAASLKGEQDCQLVQDIQEHVVEIFEACNFQDLTGQRITKVVQTLKFIEQHIIRMMEIWGGIESFKDIAPIEMPARHDAGKLLNGPKIDGDPGHASQDDIDALFG